MRCGDRHDQAMALHPAENRGYRELYAYSRQLAEHWRALSAALADPDLTKVLDRGAAAADDLIEELAPLTARHDLHGKPAAQGAGKSIAGGARVRDRFLERNQAARFAIEDLQHVVTLLAYLARASETSGNTRALGVLRALGAKAQAPGGRDPQGRGGARRRSRRRRRAARRVDGREGRPPGRLHRRHGGRGVRPPRRAQEVASAPSSPAGASPRTPSRPRGSPRCGSTTRAAPPAPARPPAAAPRRGRAARAGCACCPLSDSGALAAISAAIDPGRLLQLAGLDHVVHEADLGAAVGVDVAPHVEQLGRVRGADHVEELAQPGVRVDRARAWPAASRA